MTNKEAIDVLTSHLHHWERLLQEKICDEREGKETIEVLNMAIKVLKRDSLRLTTIADCMVVKCSANCTHCGDNGECKLAKIEVGNQSIGYPPCCYDFEDAYYASFKKADKEDENE